jgi:hypothetical protein
MGRHSRSIALLTLLIVESSMAADRTQLERPPSRETAEIRLHPASLAELIDSVGGRDVMLPRSRVLAVINPRAFLIESASALPARTGTLDRVLVLIDAGALRVDPRSLVGSNVRVRGVARSLLGIQVTAEVPWPPELAPEMVKRLEIRAAVLATSVETPDGVELTDRPILRRQQ